MIGKCARNIAYFCARKGAYPEAEAETYAYGYELLISTVINLLLILIIGAILKMFWEAVIFFAAFAVLRTIAGGFHAQTHKACIAIYSAAFLVSALLIRFVFNGDILMYILASALISSLIIYLKAPVAARNKPISQKKAIRLKRWCGVYASVNLCISCLLIPTPALHIPLIASYYSGVFAASISLAAAGILLRDEEDNGNA